MRPSISSIFGGSTSHLPQQEVIPFIFVACTRKSNSVFYILFSVFYAASFRQPRGTSRPCAIVSRILVSCFVKLVTLLSHTPLAVAQLGIERGGHPEKMAFLICCTLFYTRFLILEPVLCSVSLCLGYCCSWYTLLAREGSEVLQQIVSRYKESTVAPGYSRCYEGTMSIL